MLNISAICLKFFYDASVDQKALPDHVRQSETAMPMQRLLNLAATADGIHVTFAGKATQRLKILWSHFKTYTKMFPLFSERFWHETHLRLDCRVARGKILPYKRGM